MKLQKKVIDNELQVINNTPINATELTAPVCIATKALQIILGLDTVKHIISDYYFAFLSTLLTRLGTAAGKKPNTNSKTQGNDKQKTAANVTFATTDIIDALQTFFTAADELLLLTVLHEDNVFPQLAKPRIFILFLLFLRN